MTPHAHKEGLDLVKGGRVDDLTVVELETYPEIIHEQREAGHHGRDAPWPAELVAGSGLRCE